MSAGGTLPTLQVGRSAGSGMGPFGLWGRAFRPFFLGMALHGVLAIPWWVAAWLGWLPAPSWLIPVWWHGHEMMFGFAGAAIAGFLLTASPVWTGGPALTGRPLACLVGLWALGRVALAGGGLLPAWLVAVLDLSFLPAVALAVARTLWGSGQRRNYGVVGIVLALAVTNGLMHAEALGIASGIAAAALRFAVDLVVVLLLVVGGRIAPAFTQNALRRQGIERSVRPGARSGAVAVGAAGALAVVTLVAGRTPWTGVLATLAGLATAVRVAGWQSAYTRADPLLWGLHAGAGWVVVGLVLVGASDLGAPVPGAAGLHALTAGAMGTTILAVVTRVALGHTGRALVLPRGAVWSYAFAHLAAVARVAASFLPAVAERVLLIASGIAWAAAFGLFARLYWPILTTPRPDGRPG